MQPQKVPQAAPLCHRCKQPMTFNSQEKVGDTLVNVFHCENCDILAALEAVKPAS